MDKVIPNLWKKLLEPRRLSSFPPPYELETRIRLGKSGLLDTYPQSYPLIHRFFHISTGELSTGYPHDKRHKKYHLGRLLFRVGVPRVLHVTHTHLPSVPQALKDTLENIIEETLYTHESVEDWAQELALTDNNWGCDPDGNAVFGIKADPTVQAVLNLVLKALEELFIECEPETALTHRAKIERLTHD